MKKEYRIYRISYSEKKDAFSSWIYVGDKEYPDWDDFGMEMECRCIKGFIKEKGVPTENVDYIHYEILTRIRQAISLGYKIEFKDRPE